MYIRFSDIENPICALGNDDLCVTLKIMPCDSFTSMKVWLNYNDSYSDSLIGDWYQVNNNGNCNISFAPIFAVGLKELIWEIHSSYNSNTIKFNSIEEKNVKHFEIEKSYDSKTFEVVNIVNSKGDGSHKYTVIDAASGMPEFYRIKTVDIDEKFSLSDIKSVSYPEKGNSIIIFPNPVLENMNVRFKNFEDTEFEMYISDVSGRKIILKNINVYSKDYISTNEVNGITNGYYILHLISVEDGTSFVYPFIKK